MTWSRPFRRARTWSARRASRSVRLHVEALEAREVPTATPYILPVNPAVTTQAIDRKSVV